MKNYNLANKNQFEHTNHMKLIMLDDKFIIVLYNRYYRLMWLVKYIKINS